MTWKGKRPPKAEGGERGSGKKRLPSFAAPPQGSKSAGSSRRAAAFLARSLFAVILVKPAAGLLAVILHPGILLLESKPDRPDAGPVLCVVVLMGTAVACHALRWETARVFSWTLALGASTFSDVPLRAAEWWHPVYEELGPLQVSYAATLWTLWLRARRPATRPLAVAVAAALIAPWIGDYVPDSAFPLYAAWWYAVIPAAAIAWAVHFHRSAKPARTA